MIKNFLAKLGIYLVNKYSIQDYGDHYTVYLGRVPTRYKTPSVMKTKALAAWYAAEARAIAKQDAAKRLEHFRRPRIEAK